MSVPTNESEQCEGFPWNRLLKPVTKCGGETEEAAEMGTRYVGTLR